MYDQSRAQQPAGQPRSADPRRVSGPEPLVPAARRDEVASRLRHAINTFADDPREALEEAEAAYDEAVAQLVSALEERRRVLRAGWQEREGEQEQSDELRHALRQYRELTQRMLGL
ncbi:hypothetical protein [Streptomyces sp. NPDC006610]|jgi:outer membrane protein TolC|uniref:hypothetical protein n=1 Tax=Streptomyces sp. NPDC006610 TaxID=3154584 RepID=UPI0033AB78C5